MSQLLACIFHTQLYALKAMWLCASSAGYSLGSCLEAAGRQGLVPPKLARVPLQRKRGGDVCMQQSRKERECHRTDPQAEKNKHLQDLHLALGGGNFPPVWQAQL